MESKHPQIKQFVPLAGAQPARALASVLARNKRIGAAQRAAPSTRRWRRAGGYRVAG